MRLLPALLLLVTLVVGGALYARRVGSEEAKPPPDAPRTVAGVQGVSALGRLEPEDGVRRIAGPSFPTVVIRDLLVDRGDAVQKGELLATIDTAEVRAASLRQIQAQLANAEREYDRASALRKNGAETDSQCDQWRMRVSSLEAQRDRAQAELRLTEVHSPIDGRVLDVHARPGERIGPDGILELGNTDAMFAIAEVYETDIGRVRVGQRARVTTPVMAQPLTGVVTKIRLKVAKQDALGTDPAARKDARVIEVEVRLDDSAPAAGLTYAQVDVELLPGSAAQ